jgi:NADPH:quinone reductase
MKAVWYERQGEARDVLRYGEQPTAVPATGEVRVRLHASAVNPADANRRAGRLHGMEFPLIIPNSDGAGVVDAVGEGVARTRVGQRIWLYFGQRGRPFGTAAEYICLPEELTAPLPDGVSFFEGACLGIPAMTAHLALFDDIPIAGRTVLVTGGAGAVGHYAVQLAKWGGATVITTVSSAAKAMHAARAGADVIINYKEGNVVEQVLAAAQGRGLDRIVDVDAGANMELGLRTSAPNAVWVSYAIGPKPEPTLPLAQVIRKNLTLRGLYLSGLSPEKRHVAQQGVLRWLAEARTPVHAVAGIYALRDTAHAHEVVESKTKVGTVIIDCTAEAPADQRRALS